jgi:Tfp pilus assembly protein PilF
VPAQRVVFPLYGLLAAAALGCTRPPAPTAHAASQEPAAAEPAASVPPPPAVRSDTGTHFNGGKSYLPDKPVMGKASPVGTTLQTGHDHMLRGEHDKAMACFNDAIRADPSSSNAFVNRGFLHVRLGDYAKARADLDEAVRIDPSNGSAHLNRAFMFL